MFEQLSDLANKYPALRRYEAQGFQLVRPVLALEIEFDIESPNQRLTVNAMNSSVRPAMDQTFAC